MTYEEFKACFKEIPFTLNTALWENDEICLGRVQSQNAIGPFLS